MVFASSTHAATPTCQRAARAGCSLRVGSPPRLRPWWGVRWRWRAGSGPGRRTSVRDSPGIARQGCGDRDGPRTSACGSCPCRQGPWLGRAWWWRVWRPTAFGVPGAGLRTPGGLTRPPGPWGWEEAPGDAALGRWGPWTLSGPWHFLY